jgi:hypothetical protein
MFKGSNPITAGTRRREWEKSFEDTKPIAVVKLVVEQLTYDAMLKGLNPSTAETGRREWENSFENPNQWW